MGVECSMATIFLAIHAIQFSYFIAHFAADTGTWPKLPVCQTFLIMQKPSIIPFTILLYRLPLLLSSVFLLKYSESTFYQ